MFDKFKSFKKPARKVERVFLHCSANDNPRITVKDIHRWHSDPKPKGRGWTVIGYHYFIDAKGVIWEGRPLSKIPAAQAGHNAKTIAICVHGGQDGKPDAFNKAQMDALLCLCQEINNAYEGDITFHGHREVSAKACPVFDYEAILGLDEKGHYFGKVMQDTAVQAKKVKKLFEEKEGKTMSEQDFTKTKPEWMSKTIAGAVLMGLPLLARIAGFEIAEEELQKAADHFVSLIGFVMVVWGRYTATKRIGSA